VTHDQSEALVLSDRIAVMNDGVLLQVGNPHEVYRRPADVFVARFIGSPSINVFGGELKRQGTQLTVEMPGPEEGSGALVRPVNLAHQVSPASGKVLVGIRPEDLTLHRDPAPGRLRSIVEFVQPMGALSYAVLRIPGGEHLVQGRDDVMAAIGPDDVYDRGEAVWLDIRGNRFTLFDQESGRTIA
jgi:multiple sugar transport system ATP-binding protein